MPSAPPSWMPVALAMLPENMRHIHQTRYEALKACARKRKHDYDSV